MDVLAHAIQAEKSTTRIRIRRLPNTEAVEQIASVALGCEPTREEALADLRAREPKMSFDDLRIEVRGWSTASSDPSGNCSTVTLDKVAPTAS